MKKNLLVAIVCLATLFYGCEKNDEASINLRAKNIGSEPITLFLVQGETLRYENIELGETTNYQSWDYGNTKPDIFEVRTVSGTAGPFVYHYTPEGARLENGSYTITIDDDSIINFVKD